MLSKLSEWSKAIVTGVGTLVTILTFTNNLPFIPSAWHTTIGVVLGVLTTVVTWLTPNKPPAQA
jgi:hypothetical protein